MANLKIDFEKLDKIIKKTIEAIDNGKKEIHDIAENARRECKRLEEELSQLKQQAKELMDSVDALEAKLKESKRKLMHVNKNFDKYTQEELKQAYEIADNLRVELAVKREIEQFYIKRRNDLEVRIKDAYKTIQRADSLISHIEVALSYLTTGELQEISLQLENMQQRQMLGLRIIRAQEEERQRVAREIHDGPAQTMSNVVIRAEICERLIDIDIARAKEELKGLKDVVRLCLQDVRNIIYNLRPMSLDDLGLIPTLQRLIMTFQEETGKFVSFKTRGTFDDIRPLISLTVFRIVQEAINNIKKHADAQNIAVNLEYIDGMLRLHIFDDGRGFDVKNLKVKGGDVEGGFGLISMKERIELLNGEFNIYSEPGKGTRLNISIPCIQDIQEEGVRNEKDKGSHS